MDDDTAPRPARACPICGKPATRPHYPFCSARCRTIDLGRWLGGDYRIPAEEGPGEAGPGEGPREEG